MNLLQFCSMYDFYEYSNIPRRVMLCWITIGRFSENNLLCGNNLLYILLMSNLHWHR